MTVGGKGGEAWERWHGQVRNVRLLQTMLGILGRVILCRGDSRKIKTAVNLVRAKEPICTFKIELADL